MSFYTKYRPSNFKTIVWQEQVKDILNAEVEQWKINSSYIFFWPRWTWKTSTARIFAKAINCIWKWEKPCNKCENCNLINNWKTLDFVEIDAASHTKVEKIREEIIDKAIYPPTTLKKKVYIIDEVHMLSNSSFNALLKLMEEAPDYLIFILATTEVHKVPETIISRCEVFNFQRINEKNTIKRLKYICDQEWLKFEEWGLKLIAKISDGWLRDAIKYLEQVSIIGNINSENVTKFLWIAPEKQIVSFLEIVQSNNIDDIFFKIEQLQKEWLDLWNFVKDILLYLDDNLSKDLENNLKLVNLFDGIYSSMRNFPTPTLAYKTVIWIKIQDRTKNVKDEKLKTKIEQSQKINKKHFWTEQLEEKKENIKKTKNNTPKKITEKITKNILIENLKSPVIKWIIKNFWNVEYNKEDKFEIIIISKPDYDILQQDEKIKDLSKTIDKLAPWTEFEIKYISKKDYLNSKLQD